MAVFKDGMRVDLTKDITCKDYTYYILSIIFMIALYVGIYLGVILSPVYLWICSIMIIYLIYSYCTDTTSYIKNLV